MTTQDLLDTARAFCNLADRETNRDTGRLEKAAQYAAIAQAHAVTAQAMMMAAENQRKQERHNVWRDETFGEINDDRLTS